MAEDKFELAFRRTLEYEIGNDPDGAYTNDPLDPGGETKWGISKRAHPTVDIKNLTRDAAKEIYRAQYWAPLQLDAMDRMVASKLFDMGVNLGVRTTTSLLQEACNYLGGDLVEDGLMGPATRGFVVSYRFPQDLVTALQGGQYKHYQGITLGRPEMKRFSRGWLRRVRYGGVA